MGIISIIVACISGVTSLSTGIQGVVFYSLGRFSPKMTAPTMTVTTGGSGSTVTTSTSGSVVSIGSSPPTTAPSTLPAGAVTPSGLTQAEVASIVQRAQTTSGGTLTPAQLQSLSSALSNNSPSLVPKQFVYSPVQNVTTDASAAPTINFTGGAFVSLSTTGAVTGQGSSAIPGLPALGLAEMSIMVVDAVGSLILAVILGIAGIMVFGRSAKAAKLHRWYAWGKIPFALIGATGLGLMYRAMFSSMGPGVGFSPNYMAIMMFGFYAVLGLAYPIALLIVLRTSSVRNYYASVQ
jgi:hypothetical protein